MIAGVRLRQTAAVCAACLLISMTTIRTAAAAPADPTPTPSSPAIHASPGTGPDLERARVQHRLDRYADRIRTASARQSSSGFAGLSVDPDTSQINVWWKGSTPARVAHLLDDPPAGVRTHLYPARFSQQHLDRTADALLDTTARTAPIHIDSVAVRHDGTGVEVRYRARPAKGGARTAAAHEAALDRLRQLPEVAALREQEPPVPADNKPRWTRLNDDVSWRGGSLISLKASRPGPDKAIGTCSTAFAVRRAGYDTSRHLLTAAHCVGSWDPGHVFIKDWDGQKIASANADRPSVAVKTSIDSAIIRVNDTVRGEIYRGSFGHVRDGWWDFVVGAEANNVGDYVQTDGANSGEHSTRITADRVRGGTKASKNNTFFVEALSQAEEPYAAVSGDSGGPVFDYSGRNVTEVYARGVIWYVGDLVECDASMVTQSRKTVCGRTVGYVPIRPILKAWKATLAPR